ncbi:MAG TPA: hypothetical protein VLU46_05310 [Thermoanaerobaculia bacterium]|nr:hypothetical protein [Thermoanaerobaculia bacterium]
MSPSSSKLLAAFALVITFFAGALVGVFGDHLFMIHRGILAHPPAKFIVRRLDARLHLNDQQRAQITGIVERHDARIRTIREGVRPAVRNEIDAANSEIDRVLTPEQRATFAKMRIRLRR